MTKYPLVEVRCENCTHYGTAHTFVSATDPFCRKGTLDSLLKWPCDLFKFKSNAGLNAIIHRIRLENGLDRPNELDRLAKEGEV